MLDINFRKLDPCSLQVRLEAFAVTAPLGGIHREGLSRHIPNSTCRVSRVDRITKRVCQQTLAMQEAT